MLITTKYLGRADRVGALPVGRVPTLHDLSACGLRNDRYCLYLYLGAAEVVVQTIHVDT